MSTPRWEIVRDGAGAVARLSGDWITSESGGHWPAADIDRILEEARGEAARGGVLSFDVSDMGRWDSTLVVFVRRLRAAVDRDGEAPGVNDSGLPEAVRRLLALAGEGGGELPDATDDKRSLRTHAGLAVLRSWDAARAVSALVGIMVLRLGPAFAGRARMRLVDVVHLMTEAGAGALGIVAVVNGLVGAILAFVGAVQLQQFGAGVFVADLVGISMVREMAAVMTAIVMAGRTGGAYAAHLATMQGNEEIDALKVLGIPPHEFLVLPRMMALVSMMPLLYLYGCAVGLIGGFLVSTAILDVTVTAYLERTTEAVAGSQFLIGLVKSVVFGGLVALAGCHIGLTAGRSAADVGRAATSAVVVGIVGVIALDAVFAICLNALGL